MTVVASEADLKKALADHLSNPSFIRGWEVDKRTCIGAMRQSLRKAARDAKSFRTTSGRKGQRWLKAIDRLQRALAAAGEADFDGLLKEALDALEACASGIDTERGVCLAAEAHIKRGDLHKGKREYADAEALASAVRTAHSAYAEVAAEARAKRAAYATAVDKLRVELEAIGEGDFDGLMRQAVSVLQQQPVEEGELVHETPLTTDAVQPGGMGAVVEAASSVEVNNVSPPETGAEAVGAAGEAPVPSPASVTARLSATDSPSPASWAELFATKASVAPPAPSAEKDAVAEREAQTTASAPAVATDAAVSAAAPTDKQVHPPTSEETAEAQPDTPSASATTSEQCEGAAPTPAQKIELPATQPTSSATPLSSPSPPPSELPVLEVQEADDGCVWLGTLPIELQDALLREAFLPGAKGVCGGLQSGRSIRGAHGQPFEPEGKTTVDWSALGLHGAHTIRHEPARAGATATLLAAVRAATGELPAKARERLAAFDPSCTRVAFETMGGRSIGPTVCTHAARPHLRPAHAHLP